jgi:RNA polymerase sigma-70 factor (ECF subfamily)
LRVGAQPDPGRRDNSADNEELTIARAQQGDEQAFEALFNAHKRRVYSLCLRMTHDATEAEDLTQEAFLHLFRKISSFRGESAFGTWLHRLVVNVVLMRLRKKVLRQVPLEEAGYSREDPVDRDTGHRDFAARQYGQDDACLTGSVDRITLRRAISELPQGYRTIFVLHDVEGYEHNEIARLRRCSVGNSKSQLHKARVRLRELLRHGPAAKRAAVEALNTIVAQAHSRKQDFESRVRGFGRQVRPAT